MLYPSVEEDQVVLHTLETESDYDPMMPLPPTIVSFKEDDKPFDDAKEPITKYESFEDEEEPINEDLQHD